MNLINYSECRLCPRMCGVNRSVKRGFCGQGDRAKIARVGLHMWEEPPISGERGSGTVFFSGCTLKCVFCQNYEISSLGKGYFVTDCELADEFLRLRDMGAENINLVTPTHFLPSVISALDRVRHKLKIPVVMNCGGYERAETIKMIKGYIDVYLPDIKYFSPEISEKYSGARDYFERAVESLEEMVSQVGKPRFDGRGIMTSGVIVRHLVLPGGRHDSVKVIDELGKRFKPDDLLLSLMRQYTPAFRAGEFNELKRKVSTFEYETALGAVEKYGFEGFSQGSEAAEEGFVPEFSGECEGQA